MTYKVVPFVAKITQKDTTDHVAQQLQVLISQYADQGWEYIRLEVVETQIAPENGCFGFGAKPGFTTAFTMVVFKK